MAGENETLGGFTFGEDSTEVPGNQDVTTVVEGEEVGGFTFQQGEIERETGDATGELRRTIDGAEVIEDFNPREIEALEGFFEQYAPDINSIIFDIESSVASAAEMSEAELITELGSITITGELSELGSGIQSEVSRIHGLAEGEIISIPGESVEYVFETKKEALLYLYMQKISAYKIQEFINSLPENERQTSYWPLIKYSLLGYVGFSVAGTVLRNLNHLTVRLSNGRFGSGSYISVASSGSEGAEAVGTGEAQKRREAAQLLDYLFQGDSSTDSGRLPDINVLDHSVMAGENNIGGRRLEGTWWRELRHISRSRGRLSVGRLSELLLTPILFNREGSTIQYLQRQAQIKNDVLRQLFQTNATQIGEQIQFNRLEVVPGSEGPMVQDFRSFIDLSHEISNADEARIRDELNSFLRGLENGDLDFIANSRNKESALREIQHRLLEVATGNRGTQADLDKIFGDGTNQNPGEGVRLQTMEVRQSLIQITNYDEVITARQIHAEINGETYNERQIRIELQDFFDSVGNNPGQNRYNFKTASLIIEGILSGESKDDAIDRVFGIAGDNVDTTVTDERYLNSRNASFITTLETDILSRAQNIGSLEELSNFERNVMDHLVGHDGTPANELGRRTTRRLNVILEEKRAAGLPDVHPALNGIDDTLRNQAVFDGSGNMTEDARLLFEANTQLYVLNGGGLSIDELETAQEECRNNCNNIGDMLRELSTLNGVNTINSIGDAQSISQDSLRFGAHDLIERALIQSGNFNDTTNISVRIRSRDGALGINVVHETTNLITIHDAAGLGDIADRLRTTLSITGEIESWSSLDTSAYHGTGVNIKQYEHYGLLRDIDTFFRRAR